MQMKRSLVSSLLAVATLVGVALSVLGPQFPALALTSPFTISGTIDASDPVFDTDQVMLDCNLNWTGTNWHYETRTITTDVSAYIFFQDPNNTNGDNAFMGIFDVTSTPFDPHSFPMGNCLATGTQNVGANMVPGNTYLLVIYTAFNAAGSNYAWNGQATPGTANVVVGSPGVGAPVPAKITSITSTAANGNYGAGATLSIQVNFDKPVEYSSIGSYMFLTLNNGATAYCTYCNQYPTPLSSTYTFTYTVGGGQDIADLDALNATSLDLYMGTLRDGGGTNANITVPTGAAAASLASQKNIAIVTPSLSINDVSVTEGNAGTVNAAFTVTLSPAMQAPTITVNYATSDQTATAGTDYTAVASTMLTFTTGQTTKTVNVSVNGDTLNEANETFLVTLSGATNASISDSQGVGTITNDDPPPTLSITSVTLNEGNTGTTTYAFGVTLSTASGQNVTVSYATADGTATAGSDYTALTTTLLTFTPGQTNKTVTVLVNGDTMYEANETFTVNLSGPTNATIVTGTGTGTITNDDTQPTVSINDVTLNEGNTGTTAFNFTVSLSAASSQTITVDYTTADNTAIAGSDYTAVSNTLTFAPGATTQTITVNVTGDVFNEPTETYFVNLSNVTNATFADNQGVGTITNDDPLPTLSINDVTVTEGGSGTVNADFTVSLSAASGQTVTVSYATADGTATTAGSDYTALAATVLTFTPGETSKTVTVVVNGDTLNEANETYAVNLSGATNATIADNQGVGTITNDDPVPNLSIDNVTLAEGNAGTTAFTFTATLSVASGQTVTVNYASADGTATTANSDYTAVSNTLTYAPGETAKTITILVNGDLLNETDETFTVTLSGAANATITTATGTGTITNDDAAPTLSINSVAVTEGNAGTVNAVFTVSLSAPSGQTVTVDYASADGSAAAGSDYTAASGTLTFTPGQTTQPVTVVVSGDTVYEGDETFTVSLSNPTNSSIATATGTGTITNDDAQPTVSVNDVTLAEGNAGTTAFTFTVSLSGQSSQTITVDYGTADGSATVAGADYASASGSLTFAPLTTTQTVTVNVTGDLFNELDENFAFNVGNPVNTTIADSQGVGTITNDDAAPSLSINTVTLPEGNAGTTAFTFTVSLSAASGQTVTVNYASADGTATTAGADYSAASGTLTFNPLETTKTITVLGTGDTFFEPDENFTVTLSGATNAGIATAVGTGTMTNDDGQPSFSIADVTQAEGNTGTTAFTFTVTRSGNNNNTDTVDFVTADGVATTADNDYAAASGTLTFGPTITAQTITVTVNGDVISEPDEDFTVNLSNASAPAIISDNQAVGLIQNDEPPPGISVANVTIAENGGAGQFDVILNPANSVAVSVDYTITDGTAVLNTNYTATTTGTLNYAPGETTKPVPFTVIDNATYDGDVDFTITLSNVSGSAITQGTAVATITDDEAPPPPPVTVVNLPAPPPATPCKDVNFEEPGDVRTHFTNDADKAVLHCRVIAADGSYMTWLGGPLTSSANIGDQSILNLGVIGAVDVFSLDGATGFVGDVDVCLKGSGYMIYFNANNAPRIPQLWSAWTTDAFPGYTCTTLYAPGAVVLVSHKP